MLDAILFPSSFFDRRTVDEDLIKEYNAVLSCGLFRKIIIFSYEEWFHEGKLLLNQNITERITAVYRGWMMKPEQYRRFYNALQTANIDLITTPEEYNLFHVFPNIYTALREDTPTIMLFPEGTQVNLPAIQEAFPRFIVKDYVKSVKGADFPAYFDKNITQEEFDRQMENFYAYRGDLFTGGICIKEFVDLKLYDGTTNEHRVFYINGKTATVCRNSGQHAPVPSPPSDLIKKYCGLGSKFYTMDFAEKMDGTWTIIEAGDGNVSGLPDEQDIQEFYRKLYYSFT